MRAANTILCFFLPIVLIIGITAGAYVDTLDERKQEESSIESVEEKCPEGEHFDKYLYNCQRNCSNWNQTLIPCHILRLPGCVCDNGTVRSTLPNGRCIKPEECRKPDKKAEISSRNLETKCPRREHWDRCNANCQKNCTTRNENPGICTDDCVAGCVCNTGYVRGPHGICIRPQKCPVEEKCPEGEHFDKCLYNCQRNCSNWNQTLIPCHAMCLPGCVCDNGTVRSFLPNGKCIKPEECRKPDKKAEINSISGENFCPKNEEFAACKGLCEFDCRTRNWTTPPFCDEYGYCVSSCRCEHGYVRGPKGTCIKPDECPDDDDTSYPVERVCPENEIWSGSAHCQTNCTHPQGRGCPRMIVDGCVCKKGYQRRPDGKCIPKDQCPKKNDIQREVHEYEENELTVSGENFCPKNEEFVACRALCELNCLIRNWTLPPNCGETGYCVSSCRCVNGYVRGPKGTCIKPDECPPDDPTQYPGKRVCPENEIWRGTAHCQTNCTHPKPSLCPRIIVEGCICREGFKRRPDGKCIPKDQCPKRNSIPLEVHEYEGNEAQDELIGESFCPRNEVYAACRGLCEFSCKFKNETVWPDCKKLDRYCISSCKCVSGYVRGPKGTCIRPDECPPDDDTKYPVKRVCPENEIWSGVAHCQTNCTHPRPRECPRIIIEGCVCKNGYQRRPDGKCIPKDKCPKKNDIPLEGHEYEENETQDELPGANFCPRNEVYAACRGQCELSCKWKNGTIGPNCDKPARYCISSCICKPGYVRGPKGTCIKPVECPSDDDTEYPVERVCPKNEYWGGAAHCQTNCTHPKMRPCPKIVVEGCVCRNGYQRRPDGKCIPKDKCPKKNGIPLEAHEYEENETQDEVTGENFCPRNEVYAACRGQCELSCKPKDGTIDPNCDKPARYCISSCICMPGYVRGPKGTCITPVECPDDDDTKYPVERVCPENEIWNGVAHCQTNCTHPQQRACPKIRVTGCVCKNGYQRRPDGKCIPRDKCPKQNEAPTFPLCKKNEEFKVCQSPCPDNCTNHEDKGRMCNKICLPIPGCVCKQWYVKGPNGTCIKYDQCPKEKKPEDCTELEQYDTCGTSCEDNCDNYKQRNRTCDKKCNIGCFCLPGYVRGPKGDCVFPFDCKEQSPVSDDEQDDRLDDLPLETESRVADDATLPGLCKRNEVWSLCPSTCPDNCTNYQDKGRKCLPFCIPGCICAKGYILGPDKTCITPDKCPREKIPEDCSVLEYYDTCGTDCEDDCKNYNLPDRTCNKRCKIDCFCLPGYVRGPNGDCIWPVDCKASSAKE